VIGFLAAIHHWWPKMFGRMYNERLGKIGALLVFIGFNGTFFPQFIAGSRGMPRRYHEYAEHFQVFQQWSTVGSFILAAGLFLTLFYLLHSLFRGEKVDRHANPWGGVSLEWQTTNPPIEHNFHHQPVAEKGPYDFPEIDESLATAHHSH
jgi:cytochrome c oxidase subunit 1